MYVNSINLNDFSLRPSNLSELIQPFHEKRLIEKIVKRC